MAHYDNENISISLTIPAHARITVKMATGGIW